MAALATGRVVIAVDTSSLQRLLGGETGPDVVLLIEALQRRRVVLPPPVLSEALSDSGLTAEKAAWIRSIPLLGIMDGFWERAGFLRGWLRADGFKAFLPDCLIAQSCIDHDVPLITYDRDFRHFSRAGLTFA